MSERDFHAEAVGIVAAVRASNDRFKGQDKVYDLAVRECESRLRAEALIRQMLEMSKEEGLVDFYGWIKAAEKYLEGK